MSTNSTVVRATTDSSDGTHNVYGTDSNSSGFCCSVAKSTVAHLVINGGAGADNISENYTHSGGDEHLCGGTAAAPLNVDIYGDYGNDMLVGSDATACPYLWENLYGGEDVDTIICKGRTVAAYGDGGTGWTGDWLLDQGDASDSDTLSCTLVGGDGRDTLESFNDLGTIMYGSDGADWIFGGDGPDEIHGGPADDSMSGGGGDDSMWGDLGDDLVAGNEGDDALYGGDGADTICGGDQTDTLYGGDSFDTLQDDDPDSWFYGQAYIDTCDDGAPASQTLCETITDLTYACGSW